MKRHLSLLVLPLFLLSMSAMGATPAAHAASNPTIADTVNGPVQGSINGNERRFLGIPFAAPPVGNLRWKAPQPAASWSGIRNATSFGNACVQANILQVGGFLRMGGPVGSEDCLYLNVYTPYPTGSNLPVMLWIFGGGFIIGAGSYDPSALVTQGRVIVVTINYRIGPFGFLALPGLSAENTHGSSGNYGLEDQQAALRWVKHNIGFFGGNANNVTIFGESAGGSSVCDQIASPLATGLFQKAITESGPCEGVVGFSAAPLASTEQSGTTYATNVGCSGSASSVVSCMRAASISTLLNKANNSLTGIFGGTGGVFNPTIDGFVLTQPTIKSLESGAYNHVPIIEGTNHDEGALFALLQVSSTFRFLSASRYTTTLQNLFGSNAAQVQAEYPVSRSASADEQFARVFTDYAFACTAHTADRLFAARVPTYAYEFNEPFPLGPSFLLPLDFRLGDFHASELPYVFKGVLSIIGGLAPQLAVAHTPHFLFSPSEQRLSNQMIAYWTRFAATGNPNGSGLPNWPAYNPNTDQFQSLTAAGEGPASIGNFASEHQCSFWATLNI